ncbi:hypothetical protein [Chondromyces apiculatus]|uniref:Lipoprotein n=1 Tax=Chondromyces apiculatus DSM 436 TaxID=1192034 RepID=A0A017SXN0_9BACT|nr:hypothetical protein [Chondromyces apiculatus]EYF01723.1 Hypothetical protein CAP_7858 [Chondromyces apiculatus DSM 436]
MRFLRRATLVVSLTSALGLPACSAPLPEPQIASSAGQSGYAARYPEELNGSTARINQQDETAARVAGEVPSYPEQLKDPDWGVALSVVEEADQAGRSYDYVERARRAEGAAAFFKDNKDEISRKVAGSAQYVAKQKGCEVDVSGAAAHALDEAVEKQLQQSLRDRNEAHYVIERNRTGLGKENAAALEKQADDIAAASYAVHIAMVEEKLRLRRILEEIEAVQAELDTAIEAERSFEAGAGRTPEEKKAAAKRAEEFSASKAMLASTAEQAKNASERLEERITAAQKRHDEALAKLKEDIRKRGNLPAPAPKE